MAKTLNRVAEYLISIFMNENENVKTPETFKDRLITEAQQLEEKLDKLDAFIESDKFNEVDDVQSALLHVQATAMNTYLQCLKERLERL